jgi:hypothetical protein
MATCTLSFVLHPHQQQPSPPLYDFPTFEEKYGKGANFETTGGQNGRLPVQLADKLEAKQAMEKAD